MEKRPARSCIGYLYLSSCRIPLLRRREKYRLTLLSTGVKKVNRHGYAVSIGKTRCAKDRRLPA